MAEPAPRVDDRRVAPDADRRFWWWTAVAAALGVVLRLRSLFEPLTPDEGGALAIVRAWSDGARPYVDVWVDRPQGYLWLYRFGDLFTGPGPGFVRVLALLAGVVTVVGVADVARRLSGRWEVGAVAALITSVLSSSPAIEGFTANGELLAAAFVVPGLAVAVAVLTDRLPLRWMLVSGALAALALSVKQSGYDGLLAVCLWMLPAWWFRWRPRRDLVVATILLFVGLVAVIGLLLLHGTTFGWSDYWDAIVGFRFGARSAVSSPQWSRLVITGAIFLGLTVCLLAAAVAISRRQRRGLRWLVEPRPAFAICWLLAAGLALLTGGNYHRHYWLTVTFPLAVVAAFALVGIDRVPADAPARAWPVDRSRLLLALAAPLAVTAVLVAMPSLEQEHRIRADEELVAWVREHRSSPDDVLQPICASASWFVAADETPRYPYLWVDHVRSVPGAPELLADLLDDDERAPTFLAEFHDPDECDEDGIVAAAVERNYRRVATVADTPVLRRHDR